MSDQIVKPWALMRHHAGWADVFRIDSETADAVTGAYPDRETVGPPVTYSVRAVLGKNSPLTYVKPGLPPFLLINGSADKTVPFGQTQNFYDALKAAQVDATLISIPEGQHRIADWKKFAPDWQQRLVSWLDEKLAAK